MYSMYLFPKGERNTKNTYTHAFICIEYFQKYTTNLMLIVSGEKQLSLVVAGGDGGSDKGWRETLNSLLCLLNCVNV